MNFTGKYKAVHVMNRKQELLDFIESICRCCRRPRTTAYNEVMQIHAHLLI